MGVTLRDCVLLILISINSQTRSNRTGPVPHQTWQFYLVQEQSELCQKFLVNFTALN